MLDQLVDSDPLVHACRDDSPTVSDLVLERLAFEQADLGWEARRARARRLQSATDLAARRVKTLASIAALIVTKAKRGPSPDAPIPPATLARVRDLFLAQVGEVARDTVGTELAQELVERVTDRLTTDQSGGSKNQ